MSSFMRKVGNAEKNKVAQAGNLIILSRAFGESSGATVSAVPEFLMELVFVVKLLRGVSKIRPDTGFLEPVPQQNHVSYHLSAKYTILR